MSFVLYRRSASTSNAPAFDPATGLSLVVGAPSHVVATRVLGMTQDGERLRAVAQLVDTDHGLIHVGKLASDADVVLVAWSRKPVAGLEPLPVSVRQRDEVIANVSLSAHVAADVPIEIVGGASVYVLRIGARYERLVHSSPPTGAIVSLESLRHWLSKSADA